MDTVKPNIKSLEEYTINYIIDVLISLDGDRFEASKALGVSLREVINKVNDAKDNFPYIYRRLKYFESGKSISKLGLDHNDFIVNFPTNKDRLDYIDDQLNADYLIEQSFGKYNK